MARGPAALLGALVGAQAYFVGAPFLPEIADEHLSLFVADSLGLILIGLCVMVVIPASDKPLTFALVIPGGALIVAGLNAADVGAAATPAEAIIYASIGAVFAVALETPALALALPVFVSVIDAASLYGSGPSSLLARGDTQLGDPLSLQLPDIGNGLSGGRLGIADVVFFAVFAIFARRQGLRTNATCAGMIVALVVAVALNIWSDRAVSAIPLMAAAYFLVNIDRIPALFRRASAG